MNQALDQELSEPLSVQYVLLADGRPCDYFGTLMDIAAPELLTGTETYSNRPRDRRLHGRTGRPERGPQLHLPVRPGSDMAGAGVTVGQTAGKILG